MEEYGMTDRQWKALLRLLRTQLEDIQSADTDALKAERLERLLDIINASLAD